MITGETSQGIKFNFDERLLEDWSLIEAIAMAESEDNGEKLQGLVKYCKLILGNKGQRELFKIIKKKNDGFVPVSEVYAQVQEIMEIVKEKSNDAKKSTSSPE
jgi:hypothetical protein